MKNPWEHIDLREYEKHMASNSVRQLQTLNAFMDAQLNTFPAKSVMILGVAGGNGLDHVDTDRIDVVYAVDINRDYLAECEKRFSNLKGVLHCLRADLADRNVRLPYADIVVADLLVEYIGCEQFLNVIEKISPKYVSCVIQKNAGSGFVSDSPYMHIFDSLESVHSDITEAQLSEALKRAHYCLAQKSEQPLPNEKALVMLTYKAAAEQSPA